LFCLPLDIIDPIRLDLCLEPLQRRRRRRAVYDIFLRSASSESTFRSIAGE